MKKALLVLGLVALFAGPALAITGGYGGYIYWSATDTTSGAMSKYIMWQGEIDTGFVKVGAPVNFDNVAHNNTYVSWTAMQRRNNLEVFDPREDGGQGTLLQPAITNNTPPSSGYTGASYNVPWDIIKVDPSGPTQTNICDGRINVGGAWHTQWFGKALTAPDPWLQGTTSNGLSLATTTGIWSLYANALYDTNGDTTIDNTTNEGKRLLYVYSGSTPLDVEMGDDGALYYSTSNSVKRMWVDATGVGHEETILTVGGALNPVGFNSDGMGIAVGPGNNPIIYLMARDNETQLDTIFALRDSAGDADNLIDQVEWVWQRGNHGLNNLHSANINFYGEDVEYWENPDNGDKFLFANGYSGYLFSLELYDNGLRSVDGVQIYGNNEGPKWSSGGFELDMNPIPEPTTLLLLGSGVLGMIGYIRRRRMT